MKIVPNWKTDYRYAENLQPGFGKQLDYVSLKIMYSSIYWKLYKSRSKSITVFIEPILLEMENETDRGSIAM